MFFIGQARRSRAGVVRTAIAAACVGLFGCGAIAQQAQPVQGPSLWSDASRNSQDTFKPLIMAKRGVIAAGHPLVAEAGLRMLVRGGNAIDAGVATVFAASVVEMNGFGAGGECPILIRAAGSPVVAVNGNGTAPALATVDYYKHLAKRASRAPNVAEPSAGTIPDSGPLSALVPGCVDALLLALQNYGTLRFAETIQPAIELAQGFPLDSRFAQLLQQEKTSLQTWPSTRQIFLPGERVPAGGEIFVQADLARTFQAMVHAERAEQHRGREQSIQAVRDFFYRGAVAEQFDAFCKQAGCLIRAGDLAAYRARIEAPVTTRYRGLDVYKASFWTQGPLFLETLNILEGIEVKAMGFNSATYIHTVVEALKLGFADRDAYYGDPEFSQIPQQLLSKEYGAMRRTLIDPDRASGEHIPGDPQAMGARATEAFARERYRDRNPPHLDTTTVNVVDGAGNMFSATPSGAWVPALVVAGTGIPLSQRAQSFVLTPGHPNQLAPGKRPRITLTPTLVLDKNRPKFAFSTPCGDGQEQTLLQVFLNTVEFGMDPQQAVEAPRFNSVAMFSSFGTHADQPLVLELEGRISEDVRETLQDKGHKVSTEKDWGNWCSPTMIEYDADTGVIKGAADVRGHRYAVGW